MESRRHESLILAPAMGVHLSHHSDDHFCVQDDTRVVHDIYHGGIELNYRFEPMKGYVQLPKDHHHHLFHRSSGQKKASIRVDPYKHGLIITSNSFGPQYRIKITDQTVLGNYALEQVQTFDHKISTINRADSPIYLGKRSGTTAPAATEEEIPATLPQLELKLSRCYLTWESLHIIANRDGSISHRPVAEFHMVFIDPASKSEDEAHLEDVKAVITYMISENGKENLPLLDLLFGTEEYIDQVERQITDSTVDTTLKTFCSLASLNEDISEDCRMISPLMIPEDEEGGVLTHLPSPLSSVPSPLSSALSTGPSPLSSGMTSPRGGSSPKEIVFPSGSFSPRSPRGDSSRSFTRKLSRKVSQEESNGVWRKLSTWEIDVDEKKTKHGLFDLLNHEHTFMTYVKEVEPLLPSVAGTAYCRKDSEVPSKTLVNWFVADLRAPKSQIDELIRPVVNLRQRPYTVNRDVTIGISHMKF